MQIKTKVKAGKLSVNHNTTVGTARPMKVKTSLKAGKLSANHNTMVR